MTMTIYAPLGFRFNYCYCDIYPSSSECWAAEATCSASKFARVWFDDSYSLGTVEGEGDAVRYGLSLSLSQLPTRSRCFQRLAVVVPPRLKTSKPLERDSGASSLLKMLPCPALYLRTTEGPPTEGSTSVL
jgi:hypothetical protein